MELSELVRRDVIKVGMEARNKWEAIEELIDLLISVHELSLMDRNEVVEAVFARERSLTTGLEHGLAVPHGATGRVDDIVAAIGISKEGIPFESLDKLPAKLVVLLLIPENAFSRHVVTLAGIARLGSNPQLRESIYNAESVEQVIDIIRLSSADSE